MNNRRTDLESRITPHVTLALVAALLALSGADDLSAQNRSETLLGALRSGGLVLVMRHASSPRDAPSAAQVRPDNPARERQLDTAGRDGATAMGEAWRRLAIPVAEVFTSPTYRAVETVTYARLSPFTRVDELGDGGHSMQGVSEAQAAWLRSAVGRRPAAGNTVIVTHQPNLARAFPDWGASVADGETVVLRPDRGGTATVVGRVKIEEWAALR